MVFDCWHLAELHYWLRHQGGGGGAAQGKILSPDLWNITYDDGIKIPDSAHLIEYVDDVAAIIVARYVEEAKRKINQVIIRTKPWFEDK